MNKIELDLKVELNRGETTNQAMARTVTSPECLSASVLTICQNIDHARITEMGKRPAKSPSELQH